jgi:hypothetical protein
MAGLSLLLFAPRDVPDPPFYAGRFRQWLAYRQNDIRRTFGRDFLVVTHHIFPLKNERRSQHIGTTLQRAIMEESRFLLSCVEQIFDAGPSEPLTLRSCDRTTLCSGSVSAQAVADVSTRRRLSFFGRGACGVKYPLPDGWRVMATADNPHLEPMGAVFGCQPIVD